MKSTSLPCIDYLWRGCILKWLRYNLLPLLFRGRVPPHPLRSGFQAGLPELAGSPLGSTLLVSPPGSHPFGHNLFSWGRSPCLEDKDPPRRLLLNYYLLEGRGAIVYWEKRLFLQVDGWISCDMVGPPGFEPGITGAQAPHPSQARLRPQWRRGRDSNPRVPGGQRVSSPSP